MQCSSCFLELPAGTVRCSRCSTLVAASAPEPESNDSDLLAYGEYIPYVDNVNRPITLTATTATINNTQVEQKSAGQSGLPAPIQKSDLSSQTLFVILLVTLLIVEGLGLLSYQFLFLPSALHNQTQQVTQSFLASQAQAAQLARTRVTAMANGMLPAQLYTKATSGTPLIDDPLTQAGGSVWYNYAFNNNSANGECAFSNDVYHLRLHTGKGGICAGANTFFKDVVVQVHATILQGYAVGLMLRINYDSSAFHYYAAYIDVRGNYTIESVSANNNQILQQGPNPSSVPGNQQPVVLTFIAYGSHLYFYVNQQTVATVTDTTDVSPGQISFFGSASATSMADITFNNVKVWSLS